MDVMTTVRARGLLAPGVAWGDSNGPKLARSCLDGPMSTREATESHTRALDRLRVEVVGMACALRRWAAYGLSGVMESVDTLSVADGRMEK